MRAIHDEQRGEPSGHYSHAVEHNGLVYVSGQLPMRGGSPDLSQASVEEQTMQAIENLAAVLAAAGSGLDRVIRTTVYVSDIRLWDAVNRTYARHFGDHRPARTVVPTGRLHHGFCVEIDAIAACDIE